MRKYSAKSRSLRACVGRARITVAKSPFWAVITYPTVYDYPKRMVSDRLRGG